MITIFDTEIEFWSTDVPPEQSLLVAFAILMIGICLCK